MHSLSNTPPSPAQFNALRTACGWAYIAPERAARALAASTLHVTAHDGSEVVAMGRVVGDGVMYFHLQDIVVAPSHRGQGLGRAIVDRLLADLAPLAKPGSTIGLMAAHGVEPLYAGAGFTERPTATLGAGMTLFP
ncbi:GNAT family N-acetyltransferase [Gymnodinialimonas sp.]